MMRTLQPVAHPPSPLPPARTSSKLYRIGPRSAPADRGSLAGI